MAQKSSAQTFTQSWNKTVSWAQSNGVPYQAYYPIYQQDLQRFTTTGYGMSEPERIDAIQSAAGMKPVTSIPSDTPHPSDVLGNVRHNAAEIFTGLNPFGAGGGLLGNIFDTIKNTVEHPSSDLHAIGDIGKILNPVAGQAQTKAAMNDFSKQVLSPHNILSWVPGMYDVAQLYRGQAGLREMADTPLSTLLDILPMGKLLPTAMADSARGEAIAGRLGTTTDALRKMDGIQFGYRFAKSFPLPGGKAAGIISDAKGQPLDYRRLNIGERINLWRNSKQAGSEQGTLLKGLVLKGDKGTRLVVERLKPVFNSIKTLKDEEKVQLYAALQNDYRPITERINDEKYTPKVRNAMRVINDYNKAQLQIKLDAGEAITIQTQFGPETYAAKGNGAVVLKARDNAARADDTLRAATRKSDALQYRILNLDQGIVPVFDQLEPQVRAVEDSIRAQLPHVDPARQEPLLGALGHQGAHGALAVRWASAVRAQTPLLRNLLGLPKDVDPAARRLFPTGLPTGTRLTIHHVNAIRDLFAPGGLLDRMIQAHKDMDWVALSKYSRAISEKFDLGAFKSIPAGGPLDAIRTLSERINAYAKAREETQNALDKLMLGTKHGVLLAGGRYTKQSVAYLTQQAAKANDHFVHVALTHPPDLWSNVYLNALVDELMNSDKAASVVDEASKYLSEHGYGDTIDQLHKDPRTLVELFVRASKDSFGNGMMPDIDVGLWHTLQENAYKELGNLRAQGHEPEYVPMITPHDVERQAREGQNVFIGSIQPRSVSSSLGRAFEFNSTIYNVALALQKDAKQQITNDVVHEFFTEFFQQHLHSVPETNQLVGAYMKAEIEANMAHTLETGIREKGADAIVLEEITRAGYIKYDPKSIFGEGFSAPKLDGEYYIHRDLAQAVTDGVHKFQFPAQGFLNKSTKLFRFSILGLSPRYTAHIVFGGTALIAYRGHLSMGRQLYAGMHVFTTGMMPNSLLERMQAKGHFMHALPQKTLERYPHAEEASISMAAQEGAADRLFHQASGFTVGNSAIREWLDNHGMAGTMANWLVAAANINMKFTRAVVAMQRTIVYLDGAARAEKEGSFTELVPTQRLDKNGEPVLNPITQRPIYDEKQVVREMNPLQAHHMGMEAAEEVMGELRAMTPLERQILTRFFPFYGWTKHVLTYVFSYPVDHPYRAVFLSQLAEQNTQDISTGLPKRIQLLTFLGTPDEFGNVAARDTRVFNPLRDTANYASVTGLIQSLNPVASAAFAYVDPAIVFGQNELYPNLSYNDLYGSKQAGPQGTPWNVAEQFVPELTAADAAFNLSGHYAYLKSQGGDAFAHKLYESLNVPFFQTQHINLRQLVATDEIARYTIAKDAALRASQTGDMSYLAGYDANSTVPYPLNPNYNTTPAYIAAMNQQSEQRYGLPMYQTTAPPPNPHI